MEPKRDQWWRLKDGAIVFVAFDDREIRGAETALPFMTYRKKESHVLCSWRSLDQFDVHLPDCTGFDWKPEVFPQYLSTDDSDNAFIKRTSKHSYLTVKKNGVESRWFTWNDCFAKGRTQLTEEQALEMIVRTPQWETVVIGGKTYEVREKT